MGDNLPLEEQLSGCIQENLELLIKCPKCRMTMEQPTELDCGHVFCHKCLPIVNSPVDKRPKLLRQLSAVCVECGQFTSLPQKDISKLPGPPWIKLLHACLYGKQKQEDVNLNLPCSGCKLPESNKWCEDCEVPLCKSCAASHIVMRKMKDHQVIDKCMAPTTSTTLLCKMHDDAIQWLCQDCPRLVCYQCIHRDCSTHTYEKISDLAKAKKHKVREMILNVEAESQKLGELQRSVAQFEQDKICLFADYEAKVTQEIDNQIAQLQRKKTEMMTMLKEKEQQMKQHIVEINTVIRDKRDRLAKLHKTIHSVSMPGHQMELVVSCPLLEKKIENEQEPPYKLLEEVDDIDIQFIKTKLELPVLKFRHKSLSKHPSRFRIPNHKFVICELYEKTPIKDSKFDLPRHVQALGYDEIDSTSTSGSPISPDPPSSASLSPEENPLCMSMINEHTEPPPKSLSPTIPSKSAIMQTAMLPGRMLELKVPKPVFPNRSISPSPPESLPPPPPHLPHPVRTSPSTSPQISRGYFEINSSSMKPITPSCAALQWSSIAIQDAYDIIILPNGHTLVSFETGVMMYDEMGKQLNSQTILGAKGMTYRPQQMDILVAGYHSNTVFALHDTSLAFKADLKITLKKADKPWGCASLSNDGFVVLYSKDDKSVFLDYYDKNGELQKTQNCDFTSKGPLYISADNSDGKDLIFISDEKRDQILICSADNYMQTAIISSPRGMTPIQNSRGIVVASGTTLCQLELSKRNGRFSESKVADLSSLVISVAIHNNQFVCLTADAMQVVQCNS